MGLLLLILLVGGVFLVLQNRDLARRLTALEEQVGELGAGMAPEGESGASFFAREPVGEAFTPTESDIPPSRHSREGHPSKVDFDGTQDGDPDRPRDWVPAFAGMTDGGEPDAEDAPADGLATLFERFVAGRLLIWIGGVAFAVAGVFLVRHSIELGLVGPRVRMMLAALLGLLLIAAGEVARRRPDLAEDPRVAQALVGAGIFVLYAATYGALTLYGLFSLGAASALMALITAAALALALRHGAPTAAMGLVGGFLTPALVGDPNGGAIPLLVYLVLLDAALLALARRRGWGWLAAAALLLSFVWSGSLLMIPDRAEAFAAGLFVLALGVAGSLFRPGLGRSALLPGLIALAQLAVLVGRQELGPGAWLLFGAMSLACLALAAIRAEHRWLPVAALALGLFLLAAEGFKPDAGLGPPVAVGISLLFGLVCYPLELRRPDRLLWTALACAATIGPALVLRLTQPQLLAPASWGAVEAALALGPAGLAVLLSWRGARAGGVDRPLVVAAGTAALQFMIALSDWLGPAWLGAGWLLVALGVAWGNRTAPARGIQHVAAAVAACALIAAVAHTHLLPSTLFSSMIGVPALPAALPSPADALVALLLPAGLLAGLWRISPAEPATLRSGILAAALLLGAGGAYVLGKQLFALAGPEDFAARGFAERMLITQALFAAGWLAGSRHAARLPVDRDRLDVLATVLTGLAAARLIWFDLLFHNPVWAEQSVGSLPVLNLLLPAFVGGAAWLHAARARADGDLAKLWLGLFLFALLAGVALLVRQAFHGSLLNGPDIFRGESYGYSLAGLLLSVALLLAGMRGHDRALRIAGLALLTATIFKVFLVDAGALEGLLRILSFLGLGVALIGVNKLYSKLLRPAARAVG